MKNKISCVMVILLVTSACSGNKHGLRLARQIIVMTFRHQFNPDG